MKAIVLVALLLATRLPAQSVAEEARALGVGTRVVVRFMDGRDLKAVLVEIRPTELVIKPREGPDRTSRTVAVSELRAIFKERRGNPLVVAGYAAVAALIAAGAIVLVGLAK